MFDFENEITGWGALNHLPASGFESQDVGYVIPKINDFHCI